MINVFRLDASFGYDYTYSVAFILNESTIVFLLVTPEYSPELISSTCRSISLVCTGIDGDALRPSLHEISDKNTVEYVQNWAGATHLLLKLSLPSNIPLDSLQYVRCRLVGERYLTATVHDMRAISYSRLSSSDHSPLASVATMCGADCNFIPRYVDYYSSVGVTDFFIFLDLSTVNASLSATIDELSARHFGSSRLYIFLVNANNAHAFKRPNRLVYDYGRMGVDQMYVFHPLLVAISQILSCQLGCRYHMFFDLDEYLIYDEMWAGHSLINFFDLATSEYKNSYHNACISRFIVKEIPSMIKSTPLIAQAKPLSSANMFTKRPKKRTGHRNTKTVTVNSVIDPFFFWPDPHSVPPGEMPGEIRIDKAAYIHYINQSRYARVNMKGYLGKLDPDNLFLIDSSLCLPEHLLRCQE